MKIKNEDIKQPMWVTVKVPFKLIPGKAVIVHRTESGKEYITDFTYDEESQTVTFCVTHFSSFTLMNREEVTAVAERNPDGTVAVLCSLDVREAIPKRCIAAYYDGDGRQVGLCYDAQAGGEGEISLLIDPCPEAAYVSVFCVSANGLIPLCEAAKNIEIK